MFLHSVIFKAPEIDCKVLTLSFHTLYSLALMDCSNLLPFFGQGGVNSVLTSLDGTAHCFVDEI